MKLNQKGKPVEVENTEGALRGVDANGNRSKGTHLEVPDEAEKTVTELHAKASKDGSAIEILYHLAGDAFRRSERVSVEGGGTDSFTDEQIRDAVETHLGITEGKNEIVIGDRPTNHSGAID